MITGYVITTKLPMDSRDQVYRTSVYWNDKSKITICAFRYDKPEGVHINLTPDMAKDLIYILTQMLE